MADARQADTEARFLDALRKASADLHGVEGEMAEAARLDDKYRLGAAGAIDGIRHRLEGASARLRDLVARSERAGRFGCFPASARVLTPGGARPIASFRPGELVLSWSSSEGLRPRPVRRVLAHPPRPLWLLVTEGGSVMTTGNHRFLTPKGWIRAVNLAEGDALALIIRGAHGLATVRTSHALPRREAVFNLVTPGEHNFVVDGLIAHNFSRLRLVRTAIHRLLLDAGEEEVALTGVGPDGIGSPTPVAGLP